MSDRIGAQPFLQPARRAPGIEASPVPVASTASQGGPARNELLPAAAGIATLGIFVACIYAGAVALIALFNALPLLAVIMLGSVVGAAALTWALCHADDAPLYVRDDDLPTLSSLYEMRFRR